MTFPPGVNVAPVNMLPPVFMVPVVIVRVPRLAGYVTVLSGTYGASPCIPVRVEVKLRVPLVTPDEVKLPSVCVKIALPAAKAPGVVNAIKTTSAANFTSFISKAPRQASTPCGRSFL